MCGNINVVVEKVPLVMLKCCDLFDVKKSCGDLSPQLFFYFFILLI